MKLQPGDLLLFRGRRQFGLRTMFALVSIVAIALATGRFWVAWPSVEYIDEGAMDHWNVSVFTLLPTLDGRTSKNGESSGICAMEPWFDSRKWMRGVHYGLIPRGVDVDPDGNPWKFTESDWATISVRTIFGWSHFEIRRIGDRIIVSRLWSAPHVKPTEGMEARA